MTVQAHASVAEFEAAIAALPQAASLGHRVAEGPDRDLTRHRARTRPRSDQASQGARCGLANAARHWTAFGRESHHHRPPLHHCGAGFL
jgi:hypothetical protein